MAETIHIAVDAMGGDFGPRVTVPAAIQALRQDTSLQITLFGNKQDIQSIINSMPILGALQDRLHFVHAESEIGMNEKPSSALRTKQESSMYMAIAAVRDKALHGCVSAGNTGALMAIGRYLLKTFPGIDRPAICTSVPTIAGHSYLLDVGANIDCHSENLHQFAIMGSVLAAALDSNPSPKVALLNIGEEEIKGNEQVKLASGLLAADPKINYTGYIEGDGIYSGAADVIVCDGFVGNIALKASEGTARLINDKIRQGFVTGFYPKIIGLLAIPILIKVRSQINPANYNGASFLGLQETVVKSHGDADIDAFCRAIHQCATEIRFAVPQKINRQLEFLT